MKARRRTSSGHERTAELWAAGSWWRGRSLRCSRRRCTKLGGLCGFECHEPDLEIAGRAELIEHGNQLSVGHGLVGAQKEPLVTIAFGDARDRGQEHCLADRILADGDLEISLDRHVDR